MELLCKSTSLDVILCRADSHVRTWPIATGAILTAGCRVRGIAEMAGPAAGATFLMRPTTAQADDKVRIFTPAREMLFAGYPRLGSCASWLRTGGGPATPGIVRQECGVGIVSSDIVGRVFIRRDSATGTVWVGGETCVLIEGTLTL